MSSHNFFLSVVSTPATSGSITLEFETFDASSNVTLTLTCTGMSSSLDEESIARSIESQLTTLFIQNSMSYSGTPVFSSDNYNATFRVTRTQHVVSFWSQAQFRIRLTANSTGGIFYLAEGPLLMTVQNAKDMAAIYGVSLVQGGTALTDPQIAMLIELSCSDLLGYLNGNRIVICTYLHEQRGKDTKSIFLCPTPGISCDLPSIRRKYYLDRITDIPIYSIYSFNYVRSTGELVYRYNENFIDAIEPWGLDNEVRVTFVAGYQNIPTEIQRAVMQFMGLSLSTAGGRGDVLSLQGGSFRVTFDKFREQIYRIMLPLRAYIL